jgi:hypothetical protein
MFLSANFWPLFWGLVGGGAALLSLLAAYVRRPQHHDRQPLTVIDVPPRDHEEVGKHLVAAGQR